MIIKTINFHEWSVVGFQRRMITSNFFYLGPYERSSSNTIYSFCVRRFIVPDHSTRMHHIGSVVFDLCTRNGILPIKSGALYGAEESAIHALVRDNVHLLDRAAYAFLSEWSDQ